jgi:hypothetical protein
MDLPTEKFYGILLSSVPNAFHSSKHYGPASRFLAFFMLKVIREKAKNLGISSSRSLLGVINIYFALFNK